MSDFWDSFNLNSHSGSMDRHLKGSQTRIAGNTSMQRLTQHWKDKNPVFYEAGTRVAFEDSLDAVLTYSNPPAPGETGTVVTVRSSSLGDITGHDGQVFVKWDSGLFQPVLAEHVKVSTSKRTASSVSFRIANLGDLTGFMQSKGTAKESDLVHKATRDLWSFRQDGDEFVIERLFDETGHPLKV